MVLWYIQYGLLRLLHQKTREGIAASNFGSNRNAVLRSLLFFNLTIPLLLAKQLIPDAGKMGCPVITYALSGSILIQGSWQDPCFSLVVKSPIRMTSFYWYGYIKFGKSTL